MEDKKGEEAKRSWASRHGGNIFGAAILALFALLIVVMRVLGDS